LALQLRSLACGRDRLRGGPGFRAKRVKEERKAVPSTLPGSTAEALSRKEICGEAGQRGHPVFADRCALCAKSEFPAPKRSTRMPPRRQLQL
jgi:hypothetical protein